MMTTSAFWHLQLLGLLGVLALVVVAVGEGAQRNDEVNTDNTFCHGMYMTMFTDGFRFSLYSNNSTASVSPPCLAYLVNSWKLNMSGKFRGAMVFSFLLALLAEGLAATRFVLIECIQEHHAGQKNRKLLFTIIYALQSWMGTMVMLVSMMYSVELLLSVVAGLMVGNFLFVRDHPPTRRTTNN